MIATMTSATTAANRRVRFYGHLVVWAATNMFLLVTAEVPAGRRGQTHGDLGRHRIAVGASANPVGSE